MIVSVITRGDVRIPVSVFDHDLVESLVITDVPADHHGVSRTRMRESQRLTAKARVGRQPFGSELLDIDLALAVPELAEVEVDLLSAWLLPASPAEENVAGCLDQALSFDNTLTCLLEGAGPEMGFENG